MRIRVKPPAGPAFDSDLLPPDVLIGRSAGAGLMLDDQSVSRIHARLVQRADGWWLEDLGATNRTYLNNQLLKGSVALKEGDRIKLGGSLIEVLGAIDLTPTATEIEAERITERLRLLNDVHRALAMPISLASLLDLILERCFGALSPEEGVILLRGQDGVLQPVASRRFPGLEGAPFVSRQVMDEVAGKAKAALVMDASLDERFAESDSIRMARVKSILAAPLVDSEGVLGMIMLSSRVNVRAFSEEDLDLLVSLASAAALRVRNVALVEESTARRVMDRELVIAHELQMAMVPRETPARAEVDVAARLKPAQSVGGDFYDFVQDDDRLWFIVADVAGKSVGAALYMAVAKTLFRSAARGDRDPVEVAATMNRELCRDNERMVFVTALVGCLRLSSGDLVLVDAGHGVPWLVGKAGIASAIKVPKSVAFGVVPDAEYAAARLTIHAGAVVVSCTDGVTEARNVAGEMFGERRLLETIASARERSPEPIVAAIVQAIETFSAGAPPDDDVTLLAIAYKGTATVAMHG